MSAAPGSDPREDDRRDAPAACICGRRASRRRSPRSPSARRCSSARRSSWPRRRSPRRSASSPRARSSVSPPGIFIVTAAVLRADRLRLAAALLPPDRQPAHLLLGLLRDGRDPGGPRPDRRPDRRQRGQKRLPADAEHGDRGGAKDPRDGLRGRRWRRARFGAASRETSDGAAQPAEIRSSIEANREELAVSLVQLRGEVTHLADWRGHLERHRHRSRRPRLPSSGC